LNYRNAAQIPGGTAALRHPRSLKRVPNFCNISKNKNTTRYMERHWQDLIKEEVLMDSTCECVASRKFVFHQLFQKHGQAA
jgi:hypothetical protein